MKEVFLV